MATCNTPVARVLGSRRTCRIMLLAAALLTLPRMSTVRADDGEVEEGEGEEGEAEEGAWSVSVCVYTGGGCQADNVESCLDGSEEEPEQLFECSVEVEEYVDSEGVDRKRKVNTSPFGERASGMQDTVHGQASTNSYMRMSCKKDGKEPFLGSDGTPTLAVDLFEKDECKDMECLHTADDDHDICELPDCKLDPLPGQVIREQDPECACGMCRPKFPAGWENGRCYDLCMDNSDRGFTSSFPSVKELSTDAQSKINLCDPAQVKSAMISWEGEPCLNELKSQGFMVLAGILIPTFCVLSCFFVKYLRKTECLCWRPNGTCFGQRCGRLVIEIEDPNAGLSKYDIKMKERERNKSNGDKWAEFRAQEKKDDKRHDKFRAAQMKREAGQGAAVMGGKTGPAAAAAARRAEKQQQQQQQPLVVLATEINNDSVGDVWALAESGGDGGVKATAAAGQKEEVVDDPMSLFKRKKMEHEKINKRQKENEAKAMKRLNKAHGGGGHSKSAGGRVHPSGKGGGDGHHKDKHGHRSRGKSGEPKDRAGAMISPAEARRQKEAGGGHHHHSGSRSKSKSRHK